jgi:serine O-acetyltransferase
LLPKIIYLFIRIVFAAVIPPSATIGNNVVLGYGGLGIVVHARAVIGDRVRISPNVTIGGRSGERDVPIIEDDVLIGSGAKILGPIRIGKGAKIGANAVVLKNVPPGATAIGVPAAIVESKGGPQ